MAHRDSCNALKINFKTWSQAYVTLKEQIDIVEQMVMERTTTNWGDTDNVTETL